MKILVAGGSGMIGTALVQKLLEENHNIIIVSRTPEKFYDSNKTGRVSHGNDPVQFISWDTAALHNQIDASDIVINLCGASISNGLWTKQRKAVLTDSRLRPAQSLVQAICASNTKPKVYLQACATGYYGTESADAVDEASPSGHDFLADLCVQWEQCLQPLDQHTIRTVILRSAAVLDSNQGAFPLLKTAVNLHTGAPIGPGHQYFSWIHIADEVNAIMHCMNDTTLTGPVNLCAPEPISNRELMQTLSERAKKKMQIPIPAFLIKLTMGEKSLIYLKGQQALPGKLLTSGFTFTYPNLKSALSNLFQ